MGFKHVTQESAIDDIQLYYKLRKKEKHFIKQFILVKWYANYEDEIVATYTQNNFEL